MDSGSQAGALDSNEAYQACYLEEVCGDDSGCAPLFSSDAAAPLRGARFCLARLGPDVLWRRYSAQRTITRVPP